METRYIYDAGGNLIAEADSNNVITRYYIYGQGLMAMVTPSDQVYCYHYNAIGSTIAMTDSSQNIVNKYAYDEFGNMNSEVEAISQPFKYVGQHGVMAEPNGFYYMRARFYDPKVGRFVSEDPSGFDGGDVNLYVYVGNNPIIYIDPFGLSKQNSFWGNVKKIGSGVSTAAQGLMGALGNKDLQRGAAEGFIRATKIAIIAHSFTFTKAYALHATATLAPPTVVLGAQRAFEVIYDGLGPGAPSTVAGGAVWTIDKLTKWVRDPAPWEP